MKEVFGEIEIPLLRDRALAEDMFLSGSARWTDYDSYGDDTTYRVAFNYQVTPQFLVRSTYGTSFRAPDLYEQFLGDSEGFLNPGSLSTRAPSTVTRSSQATRSTTTARRKACRPTSSRLAE